MNSAEEVSRLALGQPRPIDDDEIDLREYWGIVNRNKWGIVGLTTVVCMLTIVVVYAMTPVYRATAQLLIESEQVKVVSIEEVYGIDSSQREYYQTQFEILNSYTLSERVVRALNIQNHAEYDPDKTDSISIRSYIPLLPPAEPMSEEQKWHEIVEIFRDNLTISPIRNTQLVDINFESIDPVLAPRVANALGNAYIESHLEARLELTQKASSWLTERLGGMRGDLERSERKLREFQERENLIDVSGVQTLTANELDELTRRLVEARKTTATAKSQYDAVGDIAGGDIDRWETLAGVVRDQLAQKLKQEEAIASSTFIELERRYGPKHPNYIAASSQMESTKNAYNSRVKLIVTGFEEQYQQAAADQRDIESAVAAAKNEIQEINRKKYSLSQLQREVNTNRQLYDLFFQRFKETNETDFAAANARFVDKATRPFVPVKPRKMLIVALAGVLSIIAGVLLAFLRAALDNTIRVAEQLEEKLGQNVMGVIPFAKKLSKDLNTTILYNDKGYNAFAEAVRSLRTSVVLSGLDKSHKVTIVTSSVPREGKTTVASNLALALGQMEKVLLVDADMRRPSLATDYGYDPGITGLAELVAGTSDIEACIQKTNFEIDLLTAGSVPPNPLDLLSSNRFEELMRVLRDRYDRIIIDSAPTQSVSDSMVLSTRADALIYVVKSDSTPVNVALNGLQRLARVGAPIIGAVLNQFDAQNAAKYGDYGSGRYGYYGYGYASKSYD